MYPDDNATKLATACLWLNPSAATAMNFLPASFSSTNIIPLITKKGEFLVPFNPPDPDIGGGALGPYVKSPGPYKCPADRSMAWEGYAAATQVMLPRVRSISMNCAIWSADDAAAFYGNVFCPPPWLN
jgi:hypothetical protein